MILTFWKSLTIPQQWTLWEKLNRWIYIPNKCECFLIRMGTDGEVVEEKEGLQEKSTPAQDQIVAVIGDPTFL